MSNLHQNSTLVACEIATTSKDNPTTLGELLQLINRKNGAEEAMMCSAAARFLQFLNCAAAEVTIDTVYARKESFISWLEERKYKTTSVKSHRFYLNRLLRRAQLAGWAWPAVTLSPEWQSIIDLMPGAFAKQIVHFADRKGKVPATLSDDDLKAWRIERANAGHSLWVAERECSRFRVAIASAGLASQFPFVKQRDRLYGVPLEKMHPALRAEVQEVLDWKQSEFAADRPAGAQIRPVTAKRLQNIFCQITGYLQNIAENGEIVSIAGLMKRQNIIGFASWSKNARRAKGQSLSTGLRALYAALRYHPEHKKLDLAWLEDLLEKLSSSAEPQETVDARKAPKYMPYAVAEQIPIQIREQRLKLKNASARRHAIYARDELLTLWLIILPWRQRNLREMRITGDNPNLYRSQVQSYSTATQPEWIAEQEKRLPNSPYWQIRFSPDETKTKHPVQMFLPFELVPVLEEYLEKHRPVLVRENTKVNTLFVNDSGRGMTVSKLRSVVKCLASRYAGVPTTPHIYRDIVAFEWLKCHPEDFLTVSKILWHRNVHTTIRIYGHRFDESAGAARMENWRADRLKTAS
jgi:integrase